MSCPCSMCNGTRYVAVGVICMQCGGSGIGSCGEGTGDYCTFDDQDKIAVAPRDGDGKQTELQEDTQKN